MSEHRYPNEQIEAVYRAIYERRDMRHFLPDPLPEDLMERLLSAAHAAPSVGYMQPWRFIRISNKSIRQQLHQLVEEERGNTAEALGDRGDQFMQLKVEGILDCGELLVATLMSERERFIFGRRTLPEMDLASLSCAIQNIWLAARAEGIGMGWVSLFDPARVAELLSMPSDSKPVAILCLGKVTKFYSEPMLAQQGWAEKIDLQDVVMENQWDPRKATTKNQSA